MAEINSIDAHKLFANTIMNVDVKRVKEQRIRVWLGIQLIRLAVWIMGCGLKVED